MRLTKPSSATHEEQLELTQTSIFSLRHNSLHPTFLQFNPYFPKTIHIPRISHLIAEKRRTNHRYSFANTLQCRVPPTVHPKCPFGTSVVLFRWITIVSKFGGLPSSCELNLALICSSKNEEVFEISES
ncbi:hypothetical protein ABFS82_03G021300 [Erythranthe guttata]